MTAWYEAFELPPPGNMMFGASDQARQDFIRIGTSIFETLEREVIGHFGGVTSEMKVLDFGCGNGRIALPFFHAHRKPTAAVDPNPHVIAFLQRVIPGAGATVSASVPPLPFDDETFDCVYSVSVWAHLPLPMQWPWLREINRVLRLGGLALITTSSFRALADHHRNPNVPGWQNVQGLDVLFIAVRTEAAPTLTMSLPRSSSQRTPLRPARPGRMTSPSSSRSRPSRPAPAGR
jgi:SAM-dependent methyltransferase